MRKNGKSQRYNEADDDSSNLIFRLHVISKPMNKLEDEGLEQLLGHLRERKRKGKERDG